MLLRHVINSTPNQIISESLHPSKFHGKELRDCVHELGLKHEQPNEVASVAKKRRLAQEESDFVPRITQAIFDVLQVEQSSDDDIIMFEQTFL